MFLMSANFVQNRTKLGTRLLFPHGFRFVVLHNMAPHMNRHHNGTAGLKRVPPIIIELSQHEKEGHLSRVLRSAIYGAQNGL